ncbi:MAG: hypothetical protein R2879_21995 [Saprospiraceae bacterium]
MNYLTRIFILGIFQFITVLNLFGQGFYCESEESSTEALLTVNCPFNQITNEDLSLMSIVKIPTRFHFISDTNSNGDTLSFHCNMGGDTNLYAPLVVQKLLGQANEYFEEPRENNVGNPGIVNDTRLRFTLDGDNSSPCGESIFIYPPGVAPNTSDETVLHFVFINDNSNPGNIGGYAGNPIYVVNLLSFYINQTSRYFDFFPHNWSRVLCHELGHNLGLVHAFSCYNDCYDMDYSVECGGQSCDSSNVKKYPGTNIKMSCVDLIEIDKSNGDTLDCTDTGGGALECCYCTSGATNNLMGYGGEQIALTPCQTETMWNRLLAVPFDSRNYFRYCEVPDTNLIIESGTSITWTSPKFLNRDVIVEGGATLTIQCEVRMGESKIITVNPGGNLIIDGGIVTHLCGSESTWAGINVEGTGLFTTSGRVTVKNEGRIEYSRLGITSINGGVVNCNQAIFYNNSKGIGFLQCPGTGFQLITKTKFYIDDDLPGDFLSHVTAYNIRGLHFSKDTFLDIRSKPDTPGNGIYSWNADFKVSSSYFEGLLNGIEAFTKSSTPNTFQVTGSTFTDNESGIRVDKITDYKITKDTFNIAKVNLPGLPEMSHGIIVSNSTRYSIFENYFLGGSGVEEKVGILIKDSKDDPNTIRDNMFIYLDIGNLAEGFNGQLLSRGLKYLCNKNDSVRLADFQVQGLDKTKGIDPYQSLSPDYSAGNSFTQLSSAFDFENNNYPIQYGYAKLIPSEEPIYYSRLRPVEMDSSGCDFIEQPDFPDNPNQEDVNIRTTRFNTFLDIYNVKTNQFNNLIDNGNSQTLLDYISHQQIGVYDTLLQISPWLSGLVLNEVLKDTFQFSSNQITELLALNPEATFRYSLYELAQGMEYFSSSQLDYVDSLLFIPSIRLNAELEMNLYKLEMQKASTEALHFIKTDSSLYNVDSISMWLYRNGTLNSYYELIDLWLAEKDTISANLVFDSIPIVFSLDSSLNEEYEGYEILFNLEKELINSNKSFFELDSMEVIELVDYAESDSLLGNLSARNILNFAHGYNYKLMVEIEYPDEISRTGNRIDQKTPNDLEISQISGPKNLNVSPNPASQSITINYKTPESILKGTILLKSILGKNIKSFPISAGEGHFTYQTEDLPDGTYIIYLIADKKILEVEKILILK